MNDRVVFYQLTHKFVNQEQNIPESARQVVYYSLAIGHHVGVLDCFRSLVEVPLDEYLRWVSSLPEGAARRKLEGVQKWGEIEVNHEHAGEILPLLNESWTESLAQCLEVMMKEPAMYLMIRRYAG